MPFRTFATETLTAANVNTYLMSQVIIRCTSTTRPTSPADGWHIYETDTQSLLEYVNSSWVKVVRIGESIVFKPKDELQNGTQKLDSDLVFEYEANTTYYMDGLIKTLGGSATTVGIYGFNAPFDADGWFSIITGDTAIEGNPNSRAERIYSPSGTSYISLACGDASSHSAMAYVRGAFTTGTSGTIRFFWGFFQGASNSIWLGWGSFLRFRKLI